MQITTRLILASTPSPIQGASRSRGITVEILDDFDHSSWAWHRISCVEPFQEAVGPWVHTWKPSTAAHATPSTNKGSVHRGLGRCGQVIRLKGVISRGKTGKLCPSFFFLFTPKNYQLPPLASHDAFHVASGIFPDRFFRNHGLLDLREWANLSPNRRWRHRHAHTLGHTRLRFHLSPARDLFRFLRRPIYSIKERHGMHLAELRPLPDALVGNRIPSFTPQWLEAYLR